MERKKKISKQLAFELPKAALVEPTPARATFESATDGTVYVFYPPNAVGERIPCLFCPHAQAESLSQKGARSSRIRYHCLIQASVFENPVPSVPKTCPRKS